MSQSIRISTGFGPTVRYIPKNTCIFPAKHTCMDVSYPTSIHSMEECRKGAWLSVSNRNTRPAPFLLYATWRDAFLPFLTWENEDVTDKSKNGDDLIAMSTMRILRVLMDHDNPMDSLGDGRKILLKALKIWKKRVSEMEDPNYCYHPPDPSLLSTSKEGWPEFSKEVLSIIVILQYLNDPNNDGFTVLNNTLEVWNGLLSKVQFDLNEEDRVHPFLYWLVLIVFKFVLNQLRTPADFRRLRSLILEQDE